MNGRASLCAARDTCSVNGCEEAATTSAILSADALPSLEFPVCKAHADEALARLNASSYIDIHLPTWAASQ